MLSSWCQYEALKYVTFPTAMAAKAFKMVPVMFMGKFMNDKSYETYEYVSAAVVGVGLFLFVNSSENLNFGENVFGDQETANGIGCGVALLSFFLAFDSFTSQWQARKFNLHKQMSPLQMMLIMNGFSSIFCFITLLHQEELSVTLLFSYNHPAFFWHVLLFTLMSTIGQVFIFYTVKNFGAVVFSIIMSIRILSSTLLSCLLYSHPITEMGVVGIMVVCGAMFYRIRRKTEGKPLIRWKQKLPTADRRAHTRRVFSQWHESMDDC
jgi:adenosine 3'-phospho 5'-phosphosulfate transporter B2